ncbi:MAG: type II toxin-antitoxin system prevent-host-death family antitoxin [Candidatus Limnocylindrales bacterium]
MRDTYSTYEAKAKLSEILRKVESGCTVQISRHGRPIAEVRPVPAAPTDLRERLGELRERGVIVPPKVMGDGLRPVADRPGALARFLADRD